MRSSNAHFGRGESSGSTAAASDPRRGTGTSNAVERTPSNFSFGAAQEALNSGKAKDQPRDGQATPVMWTTVDDVSDKLTSGEKTAPSQSGIGAFDDWKMRSLITPGAPGAGGQRITTSMGAAKVPTALMKFPVIFRYLRTVQIDGIAYAGSSETRK